MKAIRNDEANNRAIKLAKEAVGFINVVIDANLDKQDAKDYIKALSIENFENVSHGVTMITYYIRVYHKDIYEFMNPPMFMDENGVYTYDSSRWV